MGENADGITVTGGVHLGASNKVRNIMLLIIFDDLNLFFDNTIKMVYQCA